MSPGLPPIVPRKPEMDLMSVMVCGFYAFAISVSAASGRLWQMYGKFPILLAFPVYFFDSSIAFFLTNTVHALRITFRTEIRRFYPTSVSRYGVFLLNSFRV